MLSSGQVSDRYTFTVFRATVNSSALLHNIVHKALIVLHSPQNITLFFYTEDITLTGLDKQEEVAVLDGLSKIHTYMSEWEITTFIF